VPHVIERLAHLLLVAGHISCQLRAVVVQLVVPFLPRLG
jgi:hypothetical protein